MGQGVWTMTKTIGSRSGPNQKAKTQERKVEQQKGYNSTWQDKHSLSLSTQSQHGTYKHMEGGIKHIEHGSKHTSMKEHRSRHISM